MEEKSFLKSKKGKAIIIAVILVIICIILALLLRKDGYRSIAVEAVSGTVNVIGEKNNGQVYKGQRLYTGDDVSVLESSDLTLCVDSVFCNCLHRKHRKHRSRQNRQAGCTDMPASRS